MPVVSSLALLNHGGRVACLRHAERGRGKGGRSVLGVQAGGAANVVGGFWSQPLGQAGWAESVRWIGFFSGFIEEE